MREPKALPIILEGEILKIIDQTQLPSRLVYKEIRDLREAIEAITSMRIRGAPAIGLFASYAFALEALKIKASSKEEFLKRLRTIYSSLLNTRPTAVNLKSALDRMLKRAEGSPLDEIKEALLDEARAIEREEREAEERIADFGSLLIREGDSILTYCNAGGLATGWIGTALGIIKRAWERGKGIKVWISETRPLLQGSRLTAWELKQEGIPFTLITDNMVGYIMSKGGINCVIVGADRIALNGDTANKIGTYTLAVLSQRHNIPFYIAAPLSTIDPTCPSGDFIPIEERSPEEVVKIRGRLIAPRGIEVFNPAFDITPSELISAIITNRGIIEKPFEEGIRKVLKGGEIEGG